MDKRDELKEFYIPKNFKADFELMPGWGVKEFLFFIPPIILDGIILLIPMDLKFKVTILIMVIGLAFSLIHLRPTRENIHAFKHITWKIKFFKRQRLFTYKKEGYKK